MDLLLELNNADGVWIDGTNQIFEKSEFAGLYFRVKIKPLTRTELRKIRKDATTSRGLDQDIYLPKIFMSHIVDWELKDGDGNSIPFNEENQRVLLEQFPGFTNLMSAACLDAQAKSAEMREDEVKN